MALKRGPVIPGAEAYTPTYVVPALLAQVATADAGGSDVAATLWFPNGADTGITGVDQPLAIDYRIFYVAWDKAWTGGNITIKPVINGTIVNSGSHNLTIAPQGAAGQTYKVIAPGSAAIGHGDTSGFKVSCAAGFTCTGNLSIMVWFEGSATVQPNFAAHTPS